jgi:hypothetical protein
VIPEIQVRCFLGSSSISATEGSAESAGWNKSRNQHAAKENSETTCFRIVAALDDAVAAARILRYPFRGPSIDECDRSVRRRELAAVVLRPPGLEDTVRRAETQNHAGLSRSN